MTAGIKRKFLNLLGILFCTVPPISATLLYFPLWRARSGIAAISGFTLLLILLSLMPLIKVIKYIFRSPSVHVMWFFAFILFLLLSKIADEVTVIAFTGFVGNLIGAMLFSLAKKGEKYTDEK